VLHTHGMETSVFSLESPRNVVPGRSVSRRHDIIFYAPGISSHEGRGNREAEREREVYVKRKTLHTVGTKKAKDSSRWKTRAARRWTPVPRTYVLPVHAMDGACT
jgi:hypothetical protein